MSERVITFQSAGDKVKFERKLGLIPDKSAEYVAAQWGECKICKDPLECEHLGDEGHADAKVWQRRKAG